MQPPRAYLTADGRAIIEFGARYPGAIAELRRRVPAQDRRYEPAHRRWIIAPDSSLAGLRALRAMLPDAAIQTVRGGA